METPCLDRFHVRSNTFIVHLKLHDTYLFKSDDELLVLLWICGVTLWYCILEVIRFTIVWYFANVTFETRFVICQSSISKLHIKIFCFSNVKLSPLQFLKNELKLNLRNSTELFCPELFAVPENDRLRLRDDINM